MIGFVIVAGLSLITITVISLARDGLYLFDLAVLGGQTALLALGVAIIATIRNAEINLLRERGADDSDPDCFDDDPELPEEPADVPDVAAHEGRD